MDNDEKEEDLNFKIGKSYGITGNLSEKKKYIDNINNYITTLSTKSKDEIGTIEKDIDSLKKSFDDFEKKISELKNRLYNEQINIIQKLENLKKQFGDDSKGHSSKIDEIISKGNEDLKNITLSVNQWRELIIKRILSLENKENDILEKIANEHTKFLNSLKEEKLNLIEVEKGFHLGNAIKNALNEK